MPELPEVETIRRGLSEKITNVTIQKVEIRLPKIIRGEGELFAKMLETQNISSIDRRGKLLILWLENRTQAVLIHLKMTGQLIYQNESEYVAGGHPWPAFSTELPNKYTHVIITFANAGKLFFNDLRQFGFLQLASPAEVTQILKKYGLEPGLPEFTEQAFLERLAKKRGRLKSILLDQHIFSGLGNIYVDESCFWAGILPTRSVESLTLEERKQLFAAISKVITHAIEQRGTTVHDFVDADGKRGNYSDFLMAYGRAGEPCLRCHSTLGGVISKVKFAGRGTHFCDRCQH